MKLNLFILILCISSNLQAQSWQQTTDFPGANRDDAVVFTIDNKAFCGTGQTPWFDPANDFYSFDMITHQWTQVADMPTPQGRQYACGFDNDTLGFVFGGENGNTFFNNLYAYNPATDTWSVKSSLPSDGRSGSACFTLGNKAYIVGGRTEELVFSNEVWEYNMTTDIWTQKNNFSFGGKWRMSGTSNDTLGFTLFGFNDNWGYSNEIFKYDNDSDTWSILSNFPDEARNYASVKYLNNQLIVLFGMDSTNQFYNDVHLYDLSSNQWQTGLSLPELPRRGGQVFSKGLDIFYTTGLLNSPERTNETWVLQNPTNDLTSLETKEIAVFPCPTSNIIKIDYANYLESQPHIIVVNSAQGELIATYDVNEFKTQLDVSDFSTGTYTLIIIDQKGNKIGQSRFIKK